MKHATLVVKIAASLLCGSTASAWSLTLWPRTSPPSPRLFRSWPRQAPPQDLGNNNNKDKDRKRTNTRSFVALPKTSHAPLPSQWMASWALVLLSVLFSLADHLAPPSWEMRPTAQAAQGKTAAVAMPGRRRGKVLTASGILLGAVAGGSVLGKVVAAAPLKDDNDDKHVGMNGDMVGDVLNGVDEGRSSLGMVEEVDEDIDTTASNPNEESGQTQAREMVQRVLDQYEQSFLSAKPKTIVRPTTKDEAAPVLSPPAAAVAVALAPPNVEESLSPFLPLTKDTAERSLSPWLSSASSPRERLRERQRQPKARAEEAALQAKYAAIPSLADRAYVILGDLGMLDDM
jgi:hypothetical protein